MLHLRSFLAVGLGNVVLLSATNQLNHALAPFHLYLWVGGLFVAVGALRLDFHEGFWVALLTGLAADARHPVPFGTHAFLFLSGHILLYQIRHRLPRHDAVVDVLTALFTNLALFTSFSFLMIFIQREPTGSGWRLLADLLVSQLFVVAVAGWFFALQTRLLTLAGIRSEARSPLGNDRSALARRS